MTIKNLLKPTFIFLLIFGIYYIFQNNSLKTIQNITIKDLTYIMLDTVSFSQKKQQKVDILLKKLKKEGFNINESVLEALENNPYVYDLKWSVKKQMRLGLDKVTLSFKLVKDKNEFPVEVSFFVISEVPILNFISSLSASSKLYPVIILTIKFNDEIVKFTDFDAYEFLIAFYNEKECKKLIQKLINY